MARTCKLSEIKIKESYANTTPIESKMQECRNYWKDNKKQDRYVVVNHEGYLVDGYIQYLVLKENNIEEAEIKISHCKKRRWHRKDSEPTIAYRTEPTTYIYGTHPNSNCNKEFMWRIPKSNTWMAENIQIGDTVLCGTKFGVAPIIVTKIETLDKCPTELVVKKVVGKNIMRNGVIVEV